ncbi:DUF6314 family protein [Rickettsia tillamookensis]|nr:DUF6314 family protein [Rickettsia tillamookensis]
MPSKNNPAKEIFLRLSGKYRINRIIDNYGYGEGIAYFLQLNSQSFRQDKFKSKPAERTKVREQRLDSKNLLVSSFVNDAVPESLNELIYKEELQIHYNDYDYQIPANKEYRYVLEDDNIVKYFAKAENSLFHRLDFIDNSRATGSHLCGEDQYNATYIFLNPDSFTLNYKVLGPQKDYNINTVFNRV